MSHVSRNQIYVVKCQHKKNTQVKLGLVNQDLETELEYINNILVNLNMRN